MLMEAAIAAAIAIAAKTRGAEFAYLLASIPFLPFGGHLLIIWSSTNKNRMIKKM